MIPTKNKKTTSEDFEIEVTFDDLVEDEKTVELSDDDLMMEEPEEREVEEVMAAAKPSRPSLRAVLSTLPPPAVVATPAPKKNENVNEERYTRKARGSRPSHPSLSESVKGFEAETEVADECLATIAAATSRTRLADALSNTPAPNSSSVPLQLSIARVRTAVEERFAKQLSSSSSFIAASSSLPGVVVDDSDRSWPVIPAADSSLSMIPTPAATRLPPISPPPFRSSSAGIMIPPSRPSNGVFARSFAADDDNVLTLPVARKAFARVLPDAEASSESNRAAMKELTKELTGSISLSPVSSSTTHGGGGNTGNTIVMMEPRSSRTPWIIASAAIGALVAATVMRFVVPSVSGAEAAPATATTTTSADVQHTEPDTQIVAPAVKRPATQPVFGQTLQFSEADAIKVGPATAAPPAHHASVAASPAATPTPAVAVARPVVKKPTPKVSAPVQMPDGSLGLANNSSSTTSKTAEPARSAAPAKSDPPSAPKKPMLPLTPEQELAEAQLRAALR